MKHAFLVLAHDDIETLNTLLLTLDNKCCDIFVHLDINSKLNINDISIEKMKYSKVYFAERKACSWGSIGIPISIKSLINECKMHGHYDYYHLLSGHDLPIKSIEEFDSFIANNLYNNGSNNRKTNYISFYDYSDKYLTRYTHYNFFISKWRSKNVLIKVFVKTFNCISHYVQKVLGINRFKKDIKYIQPGSCWWSISDEFFKVLDDKIESVINYFSKYSFASDEAIVQYIFLKEGYENTNYQNIKETSSNLRLIDFKRGNGASPYEFSSNDYNELMNSKQFFARKFNSRFDSEIIKMIYNEVTKNE